MVSVLVDGHVHALGAGTGHAGESGAHDLVTVDGVVLQDSEFNVLSLVGNVLGGSVLLLLLLALGTTIDLSDDGDLLSTDENG